MTETDPAKVAVGELLGLHAADVADRLQRLAPEEACALLLELPPREAAAALVEIERERLPALLGAIETGRLAGLLARAEAADAADLLQRLPPPARREALARLPQAVADDVRALLAYPEDSAGGNMSDRFLAFREELTLEQVRAELTARAADEPGEDIAYLYVVDAEERLVGIVSVRDLLLRRGERRLSEVMKRDVKHALVTDDQEELARKFEHYHYLGLPVLDAAGKLVGVVKASDALEIARKEATEDMQLMVGLSGEERALTPWPTSVARRLPWLLVNVGTAILAAATIDVFESTIERVTALVIFLPIVASQGGNAGLQTLTVTIRDLTLGELAPGDGRRALLKEAIAGIVNGAAVGVVVGLVGWLWKGSALIGWIAAGATLLNQITAAAAGVLIPLALRALRMDPALASSIILTTVTDVAGFFFFLGLAALLL